MKLYSGDIGQGGNYLETSDSQKIANAIKYVSDSRPDLKNIVIDDAPWVFLDNEVSYKLVQDYVKGQQIHPIVQNIMKIVKNLKPIIIIFSTKIMS